MTPEDFIKIYYQPAGEPTADTPPEGITEAKEGEKVTHAMDLNGKKHPKTACAWDAMGPLAGSGENGPFDGLNDGEGAMIGEGGASGGAAGGTTGGAMGESVSTKTLNACLEGLQQKYPTAESISQIQKMIAGLHAGQPAKLYCGADGCEALDADPLMNDDDQAIAAASASVEAALMTYRKLTGHEYPGFIRAN